MIKEFQNLRQQMLKIMIENRQLKEALVEEKKLAIKVKKELLISIIEALDSVEKEILIEAKNNNQINALKELQKRKAPFLAILLHNEVTEMDDFMYKLPQYIEQKNRVDAPMNINLKGYLWKGEILRKAQFLENEE